MHFFKSALCFGNILMAVGVTASTAISFDGDEPDDYGPSTTGPADTTETVALTTIDGLEQVITLTVSINTATAEPPAQGTLTLTPIIGTPSFGPVESSPGSTNGAGTSTISVSETPSHWVPSVPESSVGSAQPSEDCSDTTISSSAAVITVPTGHPGNSTLTSLASLVSGSASSAPGIASTTSRKHSSTPSSTLIESPTSNHAINSGVKVGDAIVGMGAVAGYMALL
ncbi:hypothetical protein E8E13_008553 [Curvularia kusanoi]|uniref:Uncharacterized protein n=1 Tax=Curvularia kusanoi TaxID=90978 RepID=A0A9P4TBA3_CURKU|nr:hypothetical protein E8E13_008553 [Curvularia kusanoi]